MPRWTGRPAYLQVADDLRAKIRAGHIAPGGRLPSLPELISDHDVSITVIRQALGILRAEGLIATHQGKGSYVSDPLPDAPGEELGGGQYLDILQRLDEMNGRIRRLEERLAPTSPHPRVPRAGDELSLVSLVTGMTPERITELGGIDDDTSRPGTGG